MVTYPNEWKEKSLGEIGTFTKGVSLSKSDISNYGTPFILYGELYTTYKEVTYRVNRHTQKTVQNVYYSQIGDVIIPTSGETAEEIATACCVMVPNVILAGDMYIFRVTGFDGRFISYVINHLINHQISMMAQGVSIVHIRAKELGKIKFHYPSHSKQKQIADTIDIFDAHIENLTMLIEKKRMIRDGALEDLVTGRTRLNGFSGEWKKVSFDEVITPKARIGWQGLKKDEYLKYGYSYLIGGINFENGIINKAELFSVSQERYELDPYIQVAENDVLVTKDGTVGKVAKVPSLDKPATLNSGVFVFRTSNRLCGDFLYVILISSIFKNFINTLSAGSTIKHLYQKDLKNFCFDIPESIDEQKAVAATLTAMDDEIMALETEKEKITDIREGIMDDLLTGRVRLKI